MLFDKNHFLSVSLKNSLQIIIRFVVGILNMKVVAYFIGPAGLVLFGQLQNALQIGTSISGLGFTNGVIKYTSQYKSNIRIQQIITSTGFTLTVLSSILLGTLIILFSEWLSNFLFKTNEYTMVCRFLGINLLTASLLSFFLAVLNGLGLLKKFIIINIIHSISLLCIVTVATAIWKIEGMLWALVLQAIISASTSIWFIVKERIKIRFYISKIAFFKLGNYSIMTLVNGCIGPLILLIIRDIIINEESIFMAGIWEAINKVSNSYITLIAGAFSYYFLPTFSSLKKRSAIKELVNNTYKTLLPLLIIGGLSIFILRKPLINLLFSIEFTKATSIIKWQLIGDVFRVLSWVIGCLLIAKAKTKTFVATEIISGLLQITLTHLLVARFGIEGSTLAYCIENMMYFGMMYLIFYLNWGRTHAS